jgi:hypothetical protein
MILALSALVLGACASDGGSSAGGDSSSKASRSEKKDGDYPAGYTAPPAGSKFAEIKKDDTEYDVRKILGEPDDANAYMTGKAWIPFYFGSDVARTDWFYTGQGRIVFSRNRYTGALKVIKILYDPNEPDR